MTIAPNPVIAVMSIQVAAASSCGDLAPMTDAEKLTDTLNTSHPQPTLAALPEPVRARIKDMRRVGGMLSQYVRLSHAASERYTLLSKATSEGRMLVWRDRSRSLTEADLAKAEEQFDKLAQRNIDVYHEEYLGEIPIDSTMSVTDAEAVRLDCEAEVIFFHIALDLLPTEDKPLLQTDELLHCLKRIRNVAVHYRPLGVVQNDFSCQLVDRSESPREPIRMNMPGSWYIAIRAEDMLITQGVKDARLFNWFQNICENYPVWFILKAAVERLCQYYTNKPGAAG